MTLNLKSATLAALSLGSLALFVAPASAAPKADATWCASVYSLHTRNENVPKAPTKYSSRRVALISADKRGSYLYKELTLTQRAYEAAPNRELRALYGSVYSVLSERYNAIGDQVHALNALSPKASGSLVTSTMKKIYRQDQATAKHTLTQAVTLIKAGTTPLLKTCGPSSAKDLRGF